MQSMTSNVTAKNSEKLSFEEFRNEVLNDYTIAVVSRECSLLGRREVLTGKAKFGIFGDGKEVPQLAMAKAFKKGDFRSGYYRDQTFMMAIGELTPQQLFAGLYAHTDISADPQSAGRQMGGHFSTQSLNEDGTWKNLTEQYNSSSDISPTASQMPRLVGLAQASKVYRNLEDLKDKTKFSINGNEVAWGTIGNASTSEGLFFEAFNAAGVLQIPMLISIWDDEYGISVHAKYQTTKENISEILKGFQRDENGEGYEILRVKGWDYVQLVDTYNKASKIAREEHIPILVHVDELTQPQGHSTSGSHERYKNADRLEWEKNHDCILKMREWILDFELETQSGEVLRFVDSEDPLKEIEKNAKKEVSVAKRNAWNASLAPINTQLQQALQLLENVAKTNSNKNFIVKTINDLKSLHEPTRKDIFTLVRKVLPYLIGDDSVNKAEFISWLKKSSEENQEKYSSKLYDESENSVLNIKEILPTYGDKPESVDARIILRDNFDKIFSERPEVLIFGEDTGFIGDVNQGLEGLQDKYGDIRISDTGIREATIIGQGIGMAMRGLRPIAEIQYLDYILYALQIMSDDIATLRYRTYGRQIAPVIIRTRGHRLEGIWHSGSPMGMLLGALRGIHILVPRNMTKAAGFYNTLLQANEPALVIENLNGYRLKEKLPTNIGEFTTPIGVVETIKEGEDLTIVSYGSTLKIVEDVAKELQQVDINVEVIDVQSLLPFDINHDIVKSLQKTNRLLIVDEDVPGGGSAYILQEILENQNGYQYLDSKPITLTAKAHRAAYGTDGDYYSKPSSNDIFETAYSIMNETDPTKFPKLI
ncbi:MAG: 2-oxoisovalerate dehydrogenase E1 component [Candidatus Azotimanducaceae bacterium]|jgi:2-oxoisovalerate dehydrogenase E1 component